MIANSLLVVDTEQFFIRLEELLESKLDRLARNQHEPDAEPELLTRKQAAEFLHVSLATIDNLTRAGILQKHFVGSLPRFKRDELRQALDNWQPYQRK